MLPPETIAATLLAERLPLTAYFASVTRDFHLAEDDFQEISVKAVGRAAEFESPAHVLNWSRVAGRNRSIDFLRARDGGYVGLSEAMLATLHQAVTLADAHQVSGSPLSRSLNNHSAVLSFTGPEIAALFAQQYGYELTADEVEALFSAYLPQQLS